MKWYIKNRDQRQMTLRMHTPFTIKKFSPTFQDKIDVEVRQNGNGSTVWVDSNPRFQFFNWGKDSRNERSSLDELQAELQRVQHGGH